MQSMPKSPPTRSLGNLGVAMLMSNLKKTLPADLASPPERVAIDCKRNMYVVAVFDVMEVEVGKPMDRGS